MNRLRLPRLFYERVKTSLFPGAAILMTQSSVGEDGAREHTAIMGAVASRV